MYRRLLMLALLVALPAVAQELQRHEVTVSRHVFRCKTDGEVFADCNVQPPRGGTVSAFERLFQKPLVIKGNLDFETRYAIDLGDLNASVRQEVQAAMREKALTAARERGADKAQLKELQATLADVRQENHRLQVRIKNLQKQLQARGQQDQDWFWSLNRGLLRESIARLLSMIVGGIAVIAGAVALSFSIRRRKRFRPQTNEKQGEQTSVTPVTPPAGTSELAPTLDPSEFEPRVDYTELVENAANKAAFMAVTRLVEQLTPKLEEIRSAAEQRLDQMHETLKNSAPKGMDASLPPTAPAAPLATREITPTKSIASPSWVARGKSSSGPQDILKAWQSVEQRDAITPMDQATYLSELIAELDLRDKDVAREGPLFRIRRQDAAVTSLIVLDDGAFCGILTSADPEWYLLFARSQLCRRGDDYRVKFAKLFAWPGGWDGERPIRTVQPARGRRSAIDGRAQMARLSVTAVEDFEIVPGTVEVT